MPPPAGAPKAPPGLAGAPKLPKMEVWAAGEQAAGAPPGAEAAGVEGAGEELKAEKPEPPEVAAAEAALLAKAPKGEEDPAGAGEPAKQRREEGRHDTESGHKKGQNVSIVLLAVAPCCCRTLRRAGPQPRQATAVRTKAAKGRRRRRACGASGRR